MKRFAVVAAAAVLASLVGVAPAHADFHGLCAPLSGPSATIGLTVSGGTLTYAGTVKCVGTTVNITKLTLTPLGGTPSSAGTASCTACTGPISVSGTAPAAPGEYNLTMDFDITKTATPTVFRHRLGRYVVTPTGVTTICPVGVQENCAA